MKQFLALIGCAALLLPLTARAQQPAPSAAPAAPVYSYVEQMPQPPGGTERMIRYLIEHLQYPAEAQRRRIEGKVYVQFVVAADGHIEQPKVLRGVHPLLDAEALRVVPTMPAWQPGKQNGRAVNTLYTLPVVFELPAADGTVTPATAALPALADRVYTYVEQMPVPKGGPQELSNYLSAKLQYPAEARQQRVQGQVMVRFVVDEEGRITKPEVAKSVHPLLDAEALRVIGAMPAWTPGRQNGRPVKVMLLAVPVTFKL